MKRVISNQQHQLERVINFGKILTDEQTIALLNATICDETTKDAAARNAAKHAIFNTLYAFDFDRKWLLSDFQQWLNDIYDLHSDIAPDWYVLDDLNHIIGANDLKHVCLIKQFDDGYHWCTNKTHYGTAKTLIQAKAAAARALNEEFTSDVPCLKGSLPDEPFNLKICSSEYQNLLFNSTLYRNLITIESNNKLKTTTENSDAKPLKSNTDEDKFVSEKYEPPSELSETKEPEKQDARTAINNVFDETNDATLDDSNTIYNQDISFEDFVFDDDTDNDPDISSEDNIETNECVFDVESLNLDDSNNNPFFGKTWTWNDLETKYKAVNYSDINNRASCFNDWALESNEHLLAV